MCFWLHTYLSTFSECFHACQPTQLLKDYKLAASGWCESSPNRHKSFIEASRPFRLQDLLEAVDKSIVDLSVSWLVHESCSNDVEWRHCACHEEASGEGWQKLERNTILRNSRCLDLILADIVTTHLCGIKHTCTQHVCLDSSVETTYSLSFVYFFNERTDSSVFTLVRHHFSFQHIEWISNTWSDTACKRSGQELAENSCSWLISTSDWFHRFVQTYSQRRVRSLTHTCSSNSYGYWSKVNLARVTYLCRN